MELAFFYLNKAYVHLRSITLFITKIYENFVKHFHIINRTCWWTAMTFNLLIIYYVIISLLMFGSPCWIDIFNIAMISRLRTCHRYFFHYVNTVEDVAMSFWLYQWHVNTLRHNWYHTTLRCRWCERCKQGYQRWVMSLQYRQCGQCKQSLRYTMLKWCWFDSGQHWWTMLTQPEINIAQHNNVNNVDYIDETSTIGHTSPFKEDVTLNIPHPTMFCVKPSWING